MAGRALHAQTMEAHTPALTEPNLPRSVIKDSYHREVTNEVLGASEWHRSSQLLETRRALGNARPRSSKRRPHPRIRLYEEAYPDISGVDPSHAERHISLVELSPQSVISASWTAAARDAHNRRSPEPANRPQYPAEVNEELHGDDQS